MQGLNFTQPLPVFGKAQQYVENTTPLGTTSATFVEYLSMTTPSLVPGTYRVGWAFQYSASNASTEGEYRIQIDNVTDVDVELLNTSSADERSTYGNFSFEVLTAGVHTIDIDIRRNAGSGTFTIDDAKLEIWRVS